MNRPFVHALVYLALLAPTFASGQQFPSRGIVKLGPGPLPLLIHYLDGSGKPVQTQLRNLSFAPPPLAHSKELAVIARHPCGRGDVVQVSSSLPGQATGADAAGIGRFVWQLTGRFTTDGARWQFNGSATPKDDVYDFDKQAWGTRPFWAEVSTRLGATFPGERFSIRLSGKVDVGISGTCDRNSAGDALV